MPSEIVFPSVELTQDSSASSSKMKTCEVIGLTRADGMAACPCCNIKVDDGQQTVVQTSLPIPQYMTSLFTDDCSDTDISDDMDEVDHMMPGVLAEGEAYTIKQDLVQGWVHKKGTGTDWLGSRAWKPRWAVLSLAKISGHEALVPLLQIFWYPTSPTPSTVIHLDSAVLLPEDQTDRSKWNSYRFKIQHLKKTMNEPRVQISRTFSCPREGRDSWVYAINQALLNYEKEKAELRQSANLALSPRRCLNTSAWTCDNFPSASQQQRRSIDFAPTPPTSPRSHVASPKAPRPKQKLLGEALLASSD